MSYEYFPGFYDRLMDSELYDEWLEFTAHFIGDTPKKILIWLVEQLNLRYV